MRLMRAGDTRSVRRTVAADAGEVYRMISDVTRMGEWSPECRSARWLHGATRPAVGARFRGRNRRGVVTWVRTCVVEEAQPGSRFAFRTVPGRTRPDSTRWTYDLQPVPGGTLVTESYEIVRALPRWIQRAVVDRLLPHHHDMRPHMAATLERLAAAAESRLLPGQAPRRTAPST